jgi:hypothetical protein
MGRGLSWVAFWVAREHARAKQAHIVVKTNWQFPPARKEKQFFWRLFQFT